MKRGLLISGGTPVSKNLVERFVQYPIICADGGMKMLCQYGIVPSLVIGDLDSVDKEHLQLIQEKNIPCKVFPREKDGTDTELCLEEFIQSGFDQVILLGGIGTRLDHSLANLFSAKAFYQRGMDVILMDDCNEIFYREKGRYEIARGDKQYFSLISVATKTVYSTEGMKYEADHLEMTPYKPGHGVSNEWKGDCATIEIFEGGAFLFKTKDSLI